MQTQIQLLKHTDLEIVETLAKEIWPIAYAEILSTDQIEYMLKMMYSGTSLQDQAEKGVLFYLLKVDDVPAGFYAIQTNTPSEKTLRLHRLYLNPILHGKGLGKMLLNSIEFNAKLLGMTKINLNVNKYNPAVHVYQKQGYTILLEETIAVGEGYFMDDYQMEKTI